MSDGPKTHFEDWGQAWEAVPPNIASIQCILVRFVLKKRGEGDAPGK